MVRTSAIMTEAREGTVRWNVPGVGECKTWYRVVGDIAHSKKLPLVVLHGGPGACYEYMLPLERLYNQHSIPIVFYDQIGNGNSTRLSETAGDETLWTIALFTTELEQLLDHLGLLGQGFDLLGQSWGAMLGSEYATLRPQGLRRLILANGPASMEVWLKGLNALRARLPQDVQEVLDKGDREGDYQSPEYEAAIEVFYRRHLCRLEPWPAKEVGVVMDHLSSDTTVYGTMYGASELTVSGSLRDWSVIDRLSQIEVSTLLINGSHDEAQDVSMQPFFDHISKVKWITLDGCSHFAHVEQPDRFVEIVARFLN